MRSGKPINLLSKPAWPLAFSRDGTPFATISDDGIELWESATGKFLARLEGEKAAFSPDGRRVATIARPANSIMIWDAETGRNIVTLGTGEPDDIDCIAFSRDGKRLAIADSRGIIRIWDSTASGDLSKGSARQDWFSDGL